MPFLQPEAEQLTLSDQRGSMPQTPEAQEPGSTLDLASAVERRANLAGTLYERFTNPKPDEKAVPGFDPEVSVPKGAEDHAQVFNGATGPLDIQWREQQYQREQADNRTIQAHGGYGFAASMAAGLTDPIALASMALPLGGSTRLVQAGRFALGSAGTVAAQEAAMHALEVSRTGKESAINIAAGAVLGGVLGAAIRPHVPAGEFNTMADAAHEELRGNTTSENVMGPIDGRQRVIPETDVPFEKPHPESGKPDVEGAPKSEAAATPKAAEVSEAPKPAKTELPLSFYEPVGGEMHVNPEAESTAGAAAVSTPSMRGEEIARGAQTLTSAFNRVSPGAWLMTSPSVESRKLIQDLANIPETLTKNYSGVAASSPVERELWKYDGVHHQGIEARGDAFRTYRERIAGEGGEPMVRGAFDEEVAKAMRRGDKHSVPEVAQAAKETRAIAWEPLKQEAIKYNLLPEDVKVTGADSYLMRQYDTEKIKANLTDWMDRLKKGFQSQGHDPAAAGDLAHSVTRNIQGSERGTMDWEALGGWRAKDDMPTSGRLKERSLDLPDTLLEPYLNNNIDHLQHSYLRSMAPQIEMERAGLGETDTGKGTLKDRMQDLKDDYARMIERADSDGEKKDLYKRMERDTKMITAVQGRLYGVFGQPKDPGSGFVRSGRLLRSENAARLLGAATLAHFPDIANVMMRFGLPQTFAAIGKVLTSGEAFSLTRSTAKRMGSGLDMAMNQTASMLGDYANHSQYLDQRIGQAVSRGLTMISGETPLITMVQQLTSTMAQDSLIRTAQKVAAGQSVDKNLLARIAAAGIDQDALRGIAEQHEQFGAKVNGLHFGMTDIWKDQGLASKFESAVLRDAHSVTLRPGVADTPLFMSTEWGKLLRQFTTFAYAAQRGVVNPLMQGLAHGDPRAAVSLFALAGMGTLSYVTKQMAAGQPIEPWDSPRFALEVLDKSNLMGWTADLVFPALWMTGFKSLSRWSDRDPVETIGGPSVGTVMSTYQRQLPAKLLASLGMGAEDGQKGISRSDLHFLRRLLPGQNLWYARNAINSLEDAVGDSFDLPGKSNADRATELASNQ